jgi:hypothetical protein
MNIFARLKPASAAQAKPPLPRTQDKVPIVRALDDVLILRDGGVAAAVRVGSIDDALLSEAELRAKIDTYREDLLKHLRFDVQLLIGTRPQNLDPWQRKLLAAVDRLDQLERQLCALDDDLADYCAAGQFSTAAFTARFGFAPEALHGVPGQAHDVAWLLCSAQAAPDQAAIDVMRGLIGASVAAVEHWQSLIVLRARFVSGHVAASHAMVRTVCFVTTAYPRVTGRTAARISGPLTDREIAAACEVLARRCDQLTRGLGRMGMRAERVAAGEMVEEVRRCYQA